MEKTAEEWLEELPDGYRELALINMQDKNASFKRETLADGLHCAFTWSESPEGFGFWSNVYYFYHHAYKNSQLPPLPS